MKNFYLLLLTCFIITGCQTSLPARLKAADDIGEKHHFIKRIVKGGEFQIQTYQKISKPNAPYAIYLEGDGFAWKRKSELSDDPTPINPMLLSLAGLDTRPNIVYIARPCQYVMDIDGAVCDESYWSNKRMSDEIVRGINDVIISITHGAPVDLVGFSGGGGIAILIAARNPQIRSILTIAGNLDHKAFNEYHHTTQMTGSLNPIDDATKIKNIPQLHLSGAEDKIVPSSIASKFVDISHSPCVHTKIIEGVEHQKGWDKKWPEILLMPVRCND